MKKLMMSLMAILTLALIAPGYAEAKTDLEKANEKQLKAKLKEYKKGKWEILGSNTLEVALARHYDKMNQLGEDAHEVEGISTASKSKNVGKQGAVNNAVITYAQEAGSSLKGRVASDLFNNQVDGSGEFENFYAAYERLVEKEIRGEMQPSYTIIRSNGNGTYEVRTYFIVSESAAAKARQRAVEEAIKQSEKAAQYGDQISKFVQEGF